MQYHFGWGVGVGIAFALLALWFLFTAVWAFIRRLRAE